jgi:hypothetical protein
MNKYFKSIFLVFVTFMLVSNSFTLYAQADTATKDSTRAFYLVTKNGGGEVYGYILSDDGREILLETKNIGKIYIAKTDISSIKEIKETSVTVANDGSVDTYQEYRDVGPFTTRYYFTTNALPMKKGENYALIHLYGPEVHFGVTDKLSLGVMASWIASPIAVAAKYSLYEKDNTSLALGTIVGSSGYLLNAQGYFGLHWLTATKGKAGKNVSISGGMSYASLGRDWGRRSIGGKHDYKYDWNTDQKYTLPNYNAQTAVTNKLYGNSYNYDERDFYKKTPAVSAVVGLSGITPIGKKASFFFDAMGFVSGAQRVEYSDMDIEVTYKPTNSSSEVTETFTIGKGTVVNSGFNATVVLMPGMRFHKAHNKAFQVALAGVIIKNGNSSNDYSYSGNSSGVRAFPIPMVSWLRQF